MIFLPLINNITLLLTLSILYSLIWRKWDYSSVWHRVIAGILFGLVAVVGMMNPLKLQPGVIFDGRSIILSVGGLFGGPITAIASATISSLYRLYLGGAGALMGICVIISSTFWGVIYYYIRKRYPKAIQIGYLFLFGVIVHVNMLVLTLTLPSNLTNEVFKEIAIPVITIFPLGTLLICFLLLLQDSRRKAIVSLKSSEENYRLLVERASSSIIKLNRHGRVIFVNAFAQNSFGYKQDELIGKFAIESLVDKNKNTLREFASVVDELFQNPDSHATLETEVFCKNGETRWISWTYKVSQEENSNLLELICIGNDITEKKKVERELQKSEEKYRTIIELAADAILLGDSKGEIIGANIKATELTGYPIEELIGRNISTLFSKETLVKKPLRYDLLLEGEVLINERTICRKDDREVFVEMNSKKMPQNTYISMIRDITERKLINEAIKQNEKRFRTVVTSAPIVIFALDINGIFTLSEGIGLTKIGLKPGQVVGQSVYEVYKNYPEIATIVKKVLEKGEDFRVDIIIQDIVFDTLFSPINGENNEIIGIIGVATDITDRRLAEQKIIESEQLLRNQNAEYLALNEELNESNLRIREINEKLVNATEKAQESDKLKSSFLANMSHEIRTPMNGIVGFGQLLQRSKITKEEQKRYIDIIVNSSNQLLSIINDIIDISKIESGQVTLNQTYCSIEKMITDVFDLYGQMANSKNINFVISLPTNSNPVKIFSDETKIRQVLGNLVNNAIKFTENGTVEMGYNIKNSYIELFVKDTGIGIEHENHSLIFERFRQVEGANPSSIAGTGLGLAISKSLVEILGGTIWVESTIGKGARFQFTLPLS